MSYTVTDTFKAKCFDEALVSMVKLEQENDWLRTRLFCALRKLALSGSVSHNFLTKDEWWIPVGDLAEDAWEELVQFGVAIRHPMSCFNWFRLKEQNPT